MRDHFAEARRAFPRAAIFLDQIHARERNVELCLGRVFQQHEIAFGFALCDLARTQKTPDAVRHVDHVVAGLEIGEVGSESREL